MNAFHPDLAEKLRVAGELSCLRSLLELYRSQRSEYAWLWEIRLKAIDYIVKRYELDSLVELDDLNENQQTELKSSSPLLQIPAGSDAPAESEEIQQIKRRIRDLFETVTKRADSEYGAQITENHSEKH